MPPKLEAFKIATDASSDTQLDEANRINRTIKPHSKPRYQQRDNGSDDRPPPPPRDTYVQTSVVNQAHQLPGLLLVTHQTLAVHC